MSRLRHLLLVSALIATPALTVALILVPVTAEAALPSAATIQTQLQAEWDDFIARMNGAVTADGQLSLAQNANGYDAILPKLTIRLQQNNTIQLAGMTVQAAAGAGGTVAWKINLPANTPQYYQNQQIGTLAIGKQNILVTVKPAGDTWQVQSANADLANLHWQQQPTANKMAPLDTTIGQVKLAGKPAQFELTANAIQSRNNAGERQSIDRLTLTQQPGKSGSLRLSDVLVLLTGAVPQLESGHGAMTTWLQGAAGMQAHVQNLRTTKADGSPMIGVADMVLQNALVGAASDRLTLRMTGALKGIALNVPAIFANSAPQTLDFTATARNVPATYLSMPFNSDQAKAKARQALADAGTQLQIDSLDILSKGGLKANGTGLLTATTAAPTYATGLVTLNLANLQQTMAQMQTAQKSADGKPVPNAGQAVLAMMLLQGMGKPNGNQTQYIVNFMPNGQVLLNDQDLSGLLKIGGIGTRKAGGTAAPARAMPIAPVTEGAPLVPAIPSSRR